MGKTFSTRPLAGVALGMLLALSILPVTRWIVVPQLAYVIGRVGGAPGKSFAPEQVARSAPNDAKVQLALAIEYNQTPTELTSRDGRVRDALDRLRRLSHKLPNDPSICAAILGVELLPMDTSQATPAPVPNADTWRMIIADAYRGERLDPTNAFFPTIRAATLFQKGDDADAVTALHDAAQRPDWRDYSGDQIAGSWQLADLANGAPIGLAHALTAAHTSFPLLDFIAGGRLAIWNRAEALESAGKAQQGLSIRLDLFRIGSLMRAQSASVTGAMVGMILERRAAERPGGAPAILPPHLRANGKQPVDGRPYWSIVDQRRVNAFVAYMRKNGQGRSVPSVLAEFGAANEAFALVTAAPRNENVSVYAAAYPQCLELWSWTALILMALFWTLVILAIGGVARLAVFRGLFRRFDNAQFGSLTIAWICGTLAGVCVVLIASAALASVGSVGDVFALDFGYFGILTVASIMAFLVAVHRRKPLLLCRIAGACLAAATLVAIYGGGALQQSRALHTAVSLGSLQRADGDYYVPVQPNPPDADSDALFILAAPACVLIVVCLVFLIPRLRFQPALFRHSMFDAVIAVAGVVSCILAAAMP
jgi:hypothetical protein